MFDFISKHYFKIRFLNRHKIKYLPTRLSFSFLSICNTRKNGFTMKWPSLIAKSRKKLLKRLVGWLLAQELIFLDQVRGRCYKHLWTPTLGV